MSVETGRRIVLIRHAQAERETPVDQERRLDERGREEASRAGRWLADCGVVPDLARVSAARRTGETWERVSAELLTRQPGAVHEQGLYDVSVAVHRREAGVGALVPLVRETADEVRTLALVGHNPSLHELVGLLTGTTGRTEAQDEVLRRVTESGFPTASVAVLDFDGPWRSLGHGTARPAAFWTP
ncbi:SixA phosphatase family protein [Kitasatospora sp. NPDC057692]|uniref:SixA phosphatase family protein n=1 Tax=Kitasatospora sp. NPDC057692 TaxID=3346215 RepID=UPI0036A54558